MGRATKRQSSVRTAATSGGSRSSASAAITAASPRDVDAPSRPTVSSQTPKGPSMPGRSGRNWSTADSGTQKSGSCAGPGSGLAATPTTVKDLWSQAQGASDEVRVPAEVRRPRAAGHDGDRRRPARVVVPQRQ